MNFELLKQQPTIDGNRDTAPLPAVVDGYVPACIGSAYSRFSLLPQERLTAHHASVRRLLLAAAGSTQLYLRS
jgi:hypothetical protein